MTENTSKEIEELKTAILEGIKEKIQRIMNLIKLSNTLICLAPFQMAHILIVLMRTQLIDVLKQWCSKNGLKTALLTEKEDPKNFKRGFPSMRFWRSGNPTLNQSEPNELMQY